LKPVTPPSPSAANPSANHRADNADHDIHHDPFTVSVDDLTRDEGGY